VKADDLLFACGGDAVGLYGAAAHSINRIEGVAGAENVVTAMKGASPIDDFFEKAEILVSHRNGQAEVIEAAAFTLRLKTVTNVFRYKA